VPVNAHTTVHVSQHISEKSPHISAWDKHPDRATVRGSLVKGAAKYGLSWDEIGTAHVKHLPIHHGE